jgi:hypothetical protein
MTTLRDLVKTKATSDTDLHGSARGEGPKASSGLFHEDELGIKAMMPGDDASSHPHNKANPYLGKNPQTTLRALREGNLSPDQERQARAAINTYAKLSGDPVGGPRKP